MKQIIKIVGISLGLIFPLASMGITSATQECKVVGEQARYVSPEIAVSSLITALRGNDLKQLKLILGSDAKEIISSGDPVADQQGRQKFLQYYDEKSSLTSRDEKAVLEIGRDYWPFPIPLVKKENCWFFDTKSGKEEILNRRIGRNELTTIETLLAIVDAEREYALKDSDKNGILEYATKFKSDPGKKNGLYWESKDLKSQSPLGPLFAQAQEEHYTLKTKPQPYHGYFFKILFKQGPSAAGGAFDYIVKGKMLGGFAVIAYPAEYGNSGVMTFITNHDGIIYQKDLGPNTENLAKKIKIFNPDASWHKIEVSSNPL